MTTNLPATVGDLTYNEFMAMSGMDIDHMGRDIPTLRVNYDDEDEKKRPLRRGIWVLNHKDHGKVYSDSVDVVIYLNRYQYSHYDLELKKTVATSVFFKTFNDEIMDDAGGFKCGKMTRKEQLLLDPITLKAQKEIKLSRVIFLTVTMQGKTAEGVDVSVENYPALFYGRGTHYLPISNYVDNMHRNKMHGAFFQTRFTLDRKKNEGVSYWEVVPVTVGPRELTGEDYEITKKFNLLVEHENEGIVEKFNKVRAKNQGKALANSFVKEGSITADFEDITPTKKVKPKRLSNPNDPNDSVVDLA